MPGFGELLRTVERWERFPGRRRLEAGLALTFDDGPDADATPDVLDALDAAEVPATFFLVGEQVEAHPGLAREIVERGHVLGLHGFRHVEQESLGAAAGADLERGLTAVERATGVRPSLFRPPYGRFSEAAYAACGKLGLEPVLWSAWGSDWEPLPAERIAELVRRDLSDGAIVLLHDSPRYAYRPSARPTAEALPAIVAEARELGLTLKPVG